MTRDSVLFVMSIQHTGTWFAIDFLQKHPDVGFFSEYLHLVEKNPVLKDIYSRCSNSLRGSNGELVWSAPRPEMAGYDEQLVSLLVEETVKSLPEGTRSLLHEHTQSRKRRLTGNCGGNLCAESMANVFRTVVPMRDPLLSLITRNHRNSLLINSNIVDDFEFIIDLKPNCFFLPVDLNLPFAGRLALLSAALSFVNLPFSPYVNQVAEEWTPKNTSGSYDLKTWYMNNDFSSIEKRLPEEVGFLKSMERKLRPFLEAIGYRNLLWWR